jgi:RHS repeat-associated protein
VQQDANWNVTSVASAAGAVRERCAYDPYGQATFLDAGFNALAGSAVGWIYLHRGGRRDAVSGLYQFRNRAYSPTLGRWLGQDPLKYADGLNRYQYEKSLPTGKADPLGELSWPDTCSLILVACLAGAIATGQPELVEICLLAYEACLQNCPPGCA